MTAVNILELCSNHGCVKPTKNHARILCFILFANKRMFVVSRSKQPTCFFATLLQVLDIVQDKDLSHGRIREQKHPTCTIYASTPSKLPLAIFVLFVFGRFAAPDHMKHKRGEVWDVVQQFICETHVETLTSWTSPHSTRSHLPSPLQ